MKVLEEKKSLFNGDIKVIRSLGFGTYIQVNGLTQSGGVVKSIWNTTLKKIRNKDTNNCLILGLGGGTVANLLKRYFPNIKITGVDIDPVIVELGKKYLGLNTDSLRTVIQDAYSFKSGKYDLIIVDLYKGDTFPEKFESEKFIKQVQGMLKEDGIVIFNRLYYGEKRKEAVKFGNKLEKHFKKVDWVYPEANLMFICRQ